MRWQTHIQTTTRVVILALVVATLTSCGRGKDDGQLRIGVLVPTGSTPTAAAMRRASESYADEHGVGLFWRDADMAEPMGELEAQELAIVNALISKHQINALVYTPAEGSSGSAVIRQAAASEIPIVAMDVVRSDVAVPALVATNYEAAGERAASAAIDFLESIRHVNDRGEINALVVDGSWRSESERMVAKGFYNVLDKTENVRVVGRASVESPDEAFRFASEGINSYAGNVQLLLVAATRYVPGAILAAQTHGLAEWIVSAGVGAGEEASRMILLHAHDIEVDPWPAERARLALELGTRLARGEDIEPDDVFENGSAVFYSATRLITAENVAVMSDIWRNLYPE